MGYESIEFEKVPKKMMDICEPLFEHLKYERGSILFQIFKDGSGSGAFIPEESYKAINDAVLEARISSTKIKKKSSKNSFKRRLILLK